MALQEREALRRCSMRRNRGWAEAVAISWAIPGMPLGSDLTKVHTAGADGDGVAWETAKIKA